MNDPFFSFLPNKGRCNFPNLYFDLSFSGTSLTEKIFIPACEGKGGKKASSREDNGLSFPKKVILRGVNYPPPLQKAVKASNDSHCLAQPRFASRSHCKRSLTGKKGPPCKGCSSLEASCITTGVGNFGATDPHKQRCRWNEQEEGQGVAESQNEWDERRGASENRDEPKE